MRLIVTISSIICLGTALLLAKACVTPRPAATLSQGPQGDVERGRALLFNTPLPASTGNAPYYPFVRLVKMLPSLPGGALIANAVGLPEPTGGIDQLYARFVRRRDRLRAKIL